MISHYSSSASGAKYIFVEDSNSPSIEVSIYFNVGSRNDPVGASGLAHLLEHLNFQGTKIRPSNKNIVLEIENIGGNFDAFTSNEYTGFSIKAPANKGHQIIDVLFDLVFNSQLTESEIEKEKKVIVEEIRMYDDMPLEKARDIFQNKLFPNHGIGLNIAGTEQSLAKINRQQLIAFRDAYYNNNNLLISVAGNFSTNEIKNLIDSRLQKIQSLGKVENSKFSAPRSGIEVVNEKKDISQSNLIVGCYGLPRKDNYNYALKMGNALLSGGMGSLLYQSLREEHRLAYYVSSSHQGFWETGMFSVELGIDGQNLKFTYEQLLQQLKKFLNGDFPDAEFERARNYLIGMMITQFETSMDLAVINAINLLLLNDRHFEDIDDIVKNIKSVNKEEVIDIWRQIISLDDLLIVNVGPTDLII